MRNVTALPQHRSLTTRHWAGLGCCRLHQTPACDPRESSPKGRACCRVARPSPCPALPADRQLQLRERLGLCVQPHTDAPSPPIPVLGHAEEARAAALPGRTSLLSRVCPSRAVSSDSNWIWVICCSNYYIACAHPGNRSGSDCASRAEVCVGAEALCALGCSALSRSDSRGGCPGCVFCVSPRQRCWKRLGSVPAAGGCLSHPGWCKEECFSQRNRCQANC